MARGPTAVSQFVGICAALFSGHGVIAGMIPRAALSWAVVFSPFRRGLCFQRGLRFSGDLRLLGIGAIERDAKKRGAAAAGAHQLGACGIARGLMEATTPAARRVNSPSVVLDAEEVAIGPLRQIRSSVAIVPIASQVHVVFERGRGAMTTFSIHPGL
jgi:hypothetical protein